MPKDEQIIGVLDNGGVICYAPISGGIILLDKEGESASAVIGIMDFLRLREEDKIKHTGSMSQGHHIFHGRVDFYKKA